MDNHTVYFVNNSWNFMKKEVNLNNFTISYKQQGGFKSKEQAESECIMSEESFQKDLKLIKKIANVEYTFKEYLEEKTPKADSFRTLRIPMFLFEELEKKKEFNSKIIDNQKYQCSTDHFPCTKTSICDYAA